MTKPKTKPRNAINVYLPPALYARLQDFYVDAPRSVPSASLVCQRALRRFLNRVAPEEKS